MTARLTARALTLAYEDRTVVDGLDVDIPDGEVTVVVGPNACGKSTLLRALGRLLKPAGGSVLLDGTELARAELGYLSPGADRLRLANPGAHPARVLLLGGVPFGEPILMWWNFVARTRDEITGAYEQWRAEDGRFGEVRSPLDRIPAPPPPWLP